MRILTTPTYYTPRISGLTVYARRVAHRLVVAAPRNPAHYVRPEHEIRERFDSQKAAISHEKHFADLVRNREGIVTSETEPPAPVSPDNDGSCREQRP